MPEVSLHIIEVDRVGHQKVRVDMCEPGRILENDVTISSFYLIITQICCPKDHGNRDCLKSDPPEDKCELQADCIVLLENVC